MKQKLKLTDLKVQSFVTEINAQESKTFKGGSDEHRPGSLLAFVSCFPEDCAGRTGNFHCQSAGANECL